MFQFVAKALPFVVFPLQAQHSRSSSGQPQKSARPGGNAWLPELRGARQVELLRSGVNVASSKHIAAEDGEAPMLPPLLTHAPGSPTSKGEMTPGSPQMVIPTPPAPAFKPSGSQSALLMKSNCSLPENAVIGADRPNKRSRTDATTAGPG